MNVERMTMRDLPKGYAQEIIHILTGEARLMQRMDDEEADEMTGYSWKEFRLGYVAFLDLDTNDIMLVPGDDLAWVHSPTIEHLMEEGQ